MNTGQRLLGLGLGLAIAGGASAADMGTAFTYQGFLEDGGGPVTDTSPGCSFEFELWDALAAGSQIDGTQAVFGVSVDGGVFTVVLDFGSGAFNGQARWLDIKVCCPSPDCTPDPLTPRVELTPAPHALALPGLWTQQNATSPNLIGGYSGNIVGAALNGATIGGGGSSGQENEVAANYATVSGGQENKATFVWATVGGGFQNTASGDYAMVGGGRANIANGRYATVDAGFGNRAEENATVGGGYYNQATGRSSTVGGGERNVAFGLKSTIAGGYYNYAYFEATVGGGTDNRAAGGGATIAGGARNNAASFATVGGGYFNNASYYATIGGGYYNNAGGQKSSIGGGEFNSAGGPFSSIGGGYSNNAGYYATVGGGGRNNAGYYATVGGGARNNAGGRFSSIGGGYYNSAGGYFSSIPGGSNNTAAGDYSLAAGRSAKANHAGTFVWGDSTNGDCTSATTNEFRICAAGGVEVEGDLHASGTISSGNSITIDGIANTINSTSDLAIQSSGGNVGIGTTSPSATLDVVGSVTALGLNIKALGAAVLDQESAGLTNAFFDADMWQSFTPGVSGVLVRIEVRLWVQSEIDSPGTIRIYAGQGTGGTLLMEEAVTLSGQINTYHAYPLAFGPDLSSGQLYTMRIASEGPELQWTGSVSNPYPGGRMSDSPVLDAAFRTFMAQGGSASRLFVPPGTSSVGIGTSTPNANLHVVDGSAGVTPVANTVLALERDAAAYINLLTPDAFESGILFGQPTGGSASGGIIYNGGSSNGLQFRTNGNITQMVIDANGNVGIGKATPATPLHVDGGNDLSLTDGTSGYLVLGDTTGLNIAMDNNELMARNNGASATLFLQQEGGAVWVSGVFVHASDKRLKKNIRTLDSSLAKVLALRGVSFQWRKPRESEPRTQIGFIAQEVEEVVPQLVMTGDDGMKAVSYANTTALLVEAMKEMNAAAKMRDAKIDSLTAKNTELEARLGELESAMGTSSPSSRASTLGVATPALALVALFGLVTLGRSRKGGAR